MTATRGRSFAKYHLYAAIHNCRKAGVIEEGVEGKSSDEIFRNESVGRWQPIHDSHLLACFSEAFSSVDSNINEILTGPRSDDIDLLDNFPGQITHKHTLEKYQLALSASNNEPFETGQEPFQSTDLLRKIRNYFVHHETERIELGDDTHTLAKSLETKNVDFYNPFLPDTHENFPSLSLNYSVGAWAIRTAIKFTNEFRSRMGYSLLVGKTRETMMNELDPNWEEMDPQW